MPDPLLPKETNVSADYRQGGEDRGHNMPADDNACNRTGEIECFYFSNMTPQIARLNRGDWKTLEEYTRKLALRDDSVLVECGSVGEVRMMGRVSVPAVCWKVLKVKKTGQVEAFVFKNDGSAMPLPQHATTVDFLEKLTGLKIGEAIQ
jgi:endonuclease G